MNSSVDIKQVESLKDLKSALHRFRNEVKQCLDRVDNIHHRIHNELELMWISEQRKRERLLGMVQDRNAVPTPEIHMIQHRLNRLRTCISEVDKQFSTYRKMAARIKKLISHNILRAQLIVSIKIIELEKYMEISMDYEQILQLSPNFQDLHPDNSCDSRDSSENENFQN